MILKARHVIGIDIAAIKWYRATINFLADTHVLASKTSSVYRRQLSTVKLTEGYYFMLTSRALTPSHQCIHILVNLHV